MKKMKFLLLSLLFFVIMFSNNSFGETFDFTSNHIKLENNEILTNEYGYPVLKVTNNTDKDLDVTYSFYINKTDSSHNSNNFIIKAKEDILLKIPELSHLGSTGETRTIWFSWDEEDRMKPLQNQIETIPFKASSTSDSQLGLNY